MRRLCLVMGVLIVGLVLCRGSVPLVHAADFILSGDTDCVAIGIWNAATNTCTLSGNIHGSVEIRGSNITLDGAGRSIVGAGTGVGSGIEVLSFNFLYTNVTVKNVSISGWQNGVNLYRAYTTTIANTTIINNGVGISLLDSTFVTLSANTIGGNATGISAGNSFYGLAMHGNALENNSLQIQFTFINNSAPNLSIDTSNTMNGKPIYYFENENGTMHENLGAIGALYCVLCTNVTFDGFSIDGGGGPNGVGLTLSNSHDNTIRNGTFAGVKAGVNLTGPEGSERNLFTENTFHIVNLTPELGRAVGVTLGLSNDNLFLENNFLEPNDTTDTRPVAMGNQNAVNNSRFFDAATGRGNYWSRFDTPAEGCFDTDLDRHCDGSLLLDVGQYYPIPIDYAWTVQNGWVVPPSVPSIVSISPTSGPAGTTVAISGANFGSTQGSSKVAFGSATATVSSWKDTQIQATVPSLSVGTYDVVVTTSAGSSNLVSFQIISSGPSITLSSSLNRVWANGHEETIDVQVCFWKATQPA